MQIAGGGVGHLTCVFILGLLCYRVRATNLRFSEREVVTNGIDTLRPSRGRLASVLTDVQFWVPVAVLLAGLLLLEWIR